LNSAIAIATVPNVALSRRLLGVLSSFVGVCKLDNLTNVVDWHPRHVALTKVARLDGLSDQEIHLTDLFDFSGQASAIQT
jgi:hypothetical protein